MKEIYYAKIKPVANATTVSFLGEYGWYDVIEIVKIDKNGKEVVVEKFA